MFERVDRAPPDPILGLSEAVKADPNPDKINLGAGIYKDEAGRTPVLSVVKKAEQRLLAEEDSKSYLPISGAPEYAAAVQELLFAPGHEIVESGRAATVQTPGGTAALRVAADLVRKFAPDAAVRVSDPTWSNHYGVFQAAGLEIEPYPYYDADTHSLDADGMLAAIGDMSQGDVIVLHGCCHNPTGVDPTPEQWRRIAEAVADRGLLPLVDLAYQGFGSGLEEDAAGTRIVCERCPEALVTTSCSKNFSLYSERVGALTAVGPSPEVAERVMSQLKIVIRRLYSNPPAHGALIVATVLADPGLRAEWEEELGTMRRRIHDMRRLFVETLRTRAPAADFSFILDQNGVFSWSGLSEEQVGRLR
ncbi:MAG: amino acid aminotransferase, partial [Planctomycetota bacterium]